MGADNQQDTLNYFSGFIAGESSISLIKATNKRGGTGFYFTPDLTVSNSDLSILKEINRVVANEGGVISSIKGGYNLSIRGKVRVKTVLNFLDKYPLIAGDLAREKIEILKSAILTLSEKQGKGIRLVGEISKIEKLRGRLKEIKESAKAEKHLPDVRASQKGIGSYLAGIVDAEGSMGLRKCGKRSQPYFCVLMREEAIIDLFLKYFGFGNKYYRPKEKLFHFETAKTANVLRLCEFFLDNCPVRLDKNIQRLRNLQRILNDYTLGPRRNGVMI